MKSLGPLASCYCFLKKNWAMGYLAGRLISARLNSLKSDEGCEEGIVVTGIYILIPVAVKRNWDFKQLKKKNNRSSKVCLLINDSEGGKSALLSLF